MRVLVLGPPSAARIRVQKLLAAAGDATDACHDRSWGCAGMDDLCPLDGRDIDVAVAVAESGVPFDAQGIACAYRARIPIVTIGARANDPVNRFATANAARADDAAVEAIRLASADASGHRTAVEEAVAAHLATGENVSVTVRRRANAVDIVLAGDLAPARSAALTDIARAALRAYDQRVAVINVSAASG